MVAGLLCRYCFCDFERDIYCIMLCMHFRSIYAVIVNTHFGGVCFIWISYMRLC